jgi:hypothetical protein
MLDMEDDMSTKKVLTFVLVVCIAMLVPIIHPWLAKTAQALPSTQEGGTISYLGTLADETGQPVADGSYNFVFSLYKAERGGEKLWTEVQEGIALRKGNFIAFLGSVNAIPAEVLREDPYWLGVEVRGPGEMDFTSLEPRQELSANLPASLNSLSDGSSCAHTHLFENWLGSNNDYALRIENNGTGYGIRGISLGTSADSAGVVGAAYASGGSGVYGLTLSNGRGVYGESYGGDAVDGLTHVGNKSGVYGHSADGFGVTGRSTNNYAVAGISENLYGVYGEDAGADPDNSYAVYANGDMKTEDDLYVVDQLLVYGFSTFSGGKSGYVVDIAKNDDAVPLTAGDVVVISGAAPAVLGDIPVIKVRLSKGANTSEIIGVVDQHYIPAPAARQSTANDTTKVESAVDEAVIVPGEYLTIVTLGSFKAIKVDASYGSIAPGDLLVASPTPGFAMRATSPAVGTIIGKALGALESGSGLIPVIITMQ